MWMCGKKVKPGFQYRTQLCIDTVLLLCSGKNTQRRKALNLITLLVNIENFYNKIKIAMNVANSLNLKFYGKTVFYYWKSKEIRKINSSIREKTLSI